MGALMIIRADVTDPEKFVAYAKRAPALIEKFGGRYRSMRGECIQLEGATDDRKTVVSEWPSMEAAQTFWHSDEYAEVKALRDGAATITVHLVEITGE